MGLAVVYDSSSEDLANSISRRLNADAVKLEQKVFPDGEQYVRVPRPLNGMEVLYVSRAYPNQDASLVRIMLAVDAIKGAGASRVRVFIPYMPYARQDRRFLDGEPISINVVLSALKGLGVDELMVVDIHKPQSLEQYPGFRNLEPFKLYADYLKGLLTNPVVICPDMGSAWRAERLSKLLNAPYECLEKHRDRYTGEVAFTLRRLNVAGMDVVIVDDIISTGGTIVGASKILRDMGARSIVVAAAHCIMVGDAEERLSKAVNNVYCTNSIPGRHSVFNVAELVS